VGMSENSDSVVLIVSEETGSVSIANMGELKEINSKEKLKRALTKIFKEIHV